MQFVMNRDFRIAHLGHTLVFAKDKPLYVPPELRAEVRKFGGTEVEGQKNDGLEASIEAEKPEFPTPKSEPQGEDRENRLLEAVEYLVKENDPDKFGANSAPKIISIYDIVHFRIDSKERNRIWDTYRTRKEATANPSNSNTEAVVSDDT